MAAKQYDQLVFRDDFMFCKVLQNNPDLCHELLVLVLGQEVGELVEVNRQRPIEITPNGRGVRFDVYAKDDRSVVYDIEMQNAHNEDLPKRTRYIQGLMDLEQLERGSRFDELTRSYVIFICSFNLHEGIGRHKYSFRNLCIEDPAIELGDGTEKIFLCTAGSADDVSPQMKDFLNYVAGGTPAGDFTKKLESAVSDARQNPQWRKEYMDLQDYVDKAKEEGRAEERVNTERERARADEEKVRADEAEARADEAEARADLAEKELALLRAELARVKT